MKRSKILTRYQVTSSVRGTVDRQLPWVTINKCHGKLLPGITNNTVAETIKQLSIAVTNQLYFA